MVELKKQNKKENTKIYKEVLKDLRKDVNNSVSINHVGSTSLPNMYGKNIIDILIGVKDINEMNEITNVIINHGYFIGNNRGDLYRFFANRKEETKSGDIHIHLAIIESDRYKDFLVLKEYLLKNANERKDYSNFKRKMINDGINNREDYKKIKSEYVSALLERARNNIKL